MKIIVGKNGMLFMGELDQENIKIEASTIEEILLPSKIILRKPQVLLLNQQKGELGGIQTLVSLIPPPFIKENFVIIRDPDFIYKAETPSEIIQPVRTLDGN